jgi:hypothetical protein
LHPTVTDQVVHRVPVALLRLYVNVTEVFGVKFDPL